MSKYRSVTILIFGIGFWIKREKYTMYIEKISIEIYLLN